LALLSAAIDIRRSQSGRQIPDLSGKGYPSMRGAALVRAGIAFDFRLRLDGARRCGDLHETRSNPGPELAPAEVAIAFADLVGGGSDCAGFRIVDRRRVGPKISNAMFLVVTERFLGALAYLPLVVKLSMPPITDDPTQR
jgi:hypothetical protein